MWTLQEENSNKNGNVCLEICQQKKIGLLELTVVHRKINRNLETLVEPVDLILQ